MSVKGVNIHPIGGLENPRLLLTVANGPSGRAIGEARLPKEFPAVQIDRVVEDSSWAVLEREDGHETSAARLTSKLLPLAYLRVDLVCLPDCLAEDQRGSGRHSGEEARPEHGGFGHENEGQNDTRENQQRRGDSICSRSLQDHTTPGKAAVSEEACHPGSVLGMPGEEGRRNRNKSTKKDTRAGEASKHMAWKRVKATRSRRRTEQNPSTDPCFSAVGCSHSHHSARRLRESMGTEGESG